MGFYINVTIYESIKGVTNRPGRIHADARMVGLGKADSIAIRDSRANMALARLMNLKAHQTCVAPHHTIT